MTPGVWLLSHIVYLWECWAALVIPDCCSHCPSSRHSAKSFNFISTLCPVEETLLLPLFQRWGCEGQEGSRASLRVVWLGVRWGFPLSLPCAVLGQRVLSSREHVAVGPRAYPWHSCMAGILGVLKPLPGAPRIAVISPTQLCLLKCVRETSMKNCLVKQTYKKVMLSSTAQLIY